MPRVLITGGAGLIGTATRSVFESRGWRVTTLDLKECDLDGRSVDHVGDIVTIENLEERLADVEGVVHLAAVSRVIDAEFDTELCTRTNVEGTARLLNAASAAKCSWFIFGSSREVYGEPNSFPVREDDGVAPINHYGRAKVLGERMVQEHCEANGMVQSIMRFSNVYGHPSDHSTRVVNAFIQRALNGEDLEIHGGGQIFDFTFIEDTAKAIFASASKLHEERCLLPPFHILPGEATSIENLAALIIEVTESSSNIAYTRGRDYDVERFHGNPSRMHEVIGFRCSIDLQVGIERSVDAHRELLNGRERGDMA